MKLSKDFILEEFIFSSTAIKNKIINAPTDDDIDNLRRLCIEILQPIRDVYGKPIIISSGYRCYELNELLGGSVTSQHLKGQAADIHTMEDTIESNMELYNIIVDLISSGRITVGQLINEYNYNWIHISLSDKYHKNQIFDIK